LGTYVGAGELVLQIQCWCPHGNKASLSGLGLFN
jgi:hypothetical protein